MSILITFYLRSQLNQRSESSVKDSHTFSPLWPQVMSLSVNLVMNSINVLRHQKFWTMHLFGIRYCKFPSGDEPICKNSLWESLIFCADSAKRVTYVAHASDLWCTAPNAIIYDATETRRPAAPLDASDVWSSSLRALDGKISGKYIQCVETSVVLVEKAREQVVSSSLTST